MNHIEQKIYNKYKKKLSYLIHAKYRKKAKNEAKIKKIYLNTDGDIGEQLTKITEEIYETYLPIINMEIEEKMNEFYESDGFKNSVISAKKIDKKKLSYKNLKKYQELKIGINNTFFNELQSEINKDGETDIPEEELKYILLSILYKIIEYIKNGYCVKIGAIFKIWLDKRDVRVNLPNVSNRIIEDRLIPKVKLCKTFDYNLFYAINKDNLAIINYYKAKMERFLMLIKAKVGKNENR